MHHDLPTENHVDDQSAGCDTPEIKGVDELSAQVFRAFIGAARMHFKLMFTTMAGHRVHPGQVMCLRLLSANDGVAQRDLARMLHVAPPTVSKMLQAMEKSGLVERRPDEADQRLTRVHLTDDGRDCEHEMGLVAVDYVNETIGAMPEADRRELARLLEDLGKRIRAASARHREDER